MRDCRVRKKNQEPSPQFLKTPNVCSLVPYKCIANLVPLLLPSIVTTYENSV